MITKKETKEATHTKDDNWRSYEILSTFSEALLGVSASQYKRACSVYWLISLFILSKYFASNQNFYIIADWKEVLHLQLFACIIINTSSIVKLPQILKKNDSW